MAFVESSDPVSQPPGPARSIAAPAGAPGSKSPATAPAAKPSPAKPEARTEQRDHSARFTAQEVLQISILQGLYRKEFNSPMDVVRFANDDPYGRQILSEAMTSGNSELMAAAWSFMDSEGKPHKHRRKT
jgi:hypothetical protein